MKQVSDPTTVWQFFHEHLGLHASDDFRGVCHFADEDSMPGAPMTMDSVAVAIGYNGFVGRCCCLHAVVQRPEKFTRAVVRDIFHYPFVVCDVEVALAFIDSTNTKSLSLTERLGFKEIATIPNGGRDGDLVVKQMLRSECRWLRPH